MRWIRKIGRAVWDRISNGWYSSLENREKSEDDFIVWMILVPIVFLYLSLLSTRSGKPIFKIVVTVFPITVFLVEFMLAKGLKLIKRKTEPSASRPQPKPTKTYNNRLQGETDAANRERRLKQLNEYLKNGIIDKEEYRILRQRYENNKL